MRPKTAYGSVRSIMTRPAGFLPWVVWSRPPYHGRDDAAGWWVVMLGLAWAPNGYAVKARSSGRMRQARATNAAQARVCSDGCFSVMRDRSFGDHLPSSIHIVRL